VKNCAICKTPGTQTHFLNDCPINTEAREILYQSTPHGIEVPLLAEGNIAAFFAQFRELEIRTSGTKINADIILPLLKAALTIASSFVKTTLASITTQQHTNPTTYDSQKPNPQELRY